MDRTSTREGIAPRDIVFECGMAAQGIVEATPANLRALREKPGGATSPPLPPRFLRHADEQTVVGLVAVLRAVGEPALRGQSFEEWGVLAAPQFPGRLVGAAALTKFARDGAATVSPHIIPQHSLHSLSGAVSIVLGLHGPNFGVGGGHEALAEAFTAALTFLDHATLPGLWLVLTGWDPEPVPDCTGWTTSESVCRGVALALVPDASQGRMLRLTALRSPCAGEDSSGIPPALTLAGLIDRLATSSDKRPEPAWSFALCWGAQIDQITSPTGQPKAA